MRRFKKTWDKTREIFKLGKPPGRKRTLSHMLESALAELFQGYENMTTEELLVKLTGKFGPSEQLLGRDFSFHHDRGEGDRRKSEKRQKERDRTRLDQSQKLEGRTTTTTNRKRGDGAVVLMSMEEVSYSVLLSEGS
jgi:hypothetical protein